ncbi:MAG: hypothetical protein WCP46_00055 [Alphaproteobacteria bacterium]
MKKVLLILALSFAACEPLPSPVNKIIVVPTQPTNSDAKYTAMGTLSLYTTAEEAFANRVSGGAYHFIYGVVNVQDKVYTSVSTTTPFNGQGKWICVSFDGGHVWKSIQVDNYGEVLQVR